VAHTHAHVHTDRQTDKEPRADREPQAEAENVHCLIGHSSAADAVLEQAELIICINESGHSNLYDQSILLCPVCVFVPLVALSPMNLCAG
jgi:hypothetical protein